MQSFALLPKKNYKSITHHAWQSLLINYLCTFISKFCIICYTVRNWRPTLKRKSHQEQKIPRSTQQRATLCDASFRSCLNDVRSSRSCLNDVRDALRGNFYSPFSSPQSALLFLQVLISDGTKPEERNNAKPTSCWMWTVPTNFIGTKEIPNKIECKCGKVDTWRQRRRKEY